MPGMGLGLSMVSSVVWSVGGSCRAYNQENKTGVVIVLNLPLVYTHYGTITNSTASAGSQP